MLKTFCMRKVIKTEIGEILSRLYDSEIEFRLENFFDDGYRWAVLGDVEEQTQKVNLRRLEIDDMIMDAHEKRERIFCESDEMKTERQIPHFLKRDWLMRGADFPLEVAIGKLAEAACRLFPDSDFTRWYANDGRAQG